MKIYQVGVVAIAATFLLAGCASKPPRQAQAKSMTVKGVKLEFAGSYDEKQNQLVLTVNGDPLMRGSFPPYTPTQNLNAKYKDLDINASCYFGSVLGSRRGIAGIVAGAVQSGTGKANDKCDITVDGQAAEPLFF